MAADADFSACKKPSYSLSNALPDSHYTYLHSAQRKGYSARLFSPKRAAKVVTG